MFNVSHGEKVGLLGVLIYEKLTFKDHVFTLRVFRCTAALFFLFFAL